MTITHGRRAWSRLAWARSRCTACVMRMGRCSSTTPASPAWPPDPHGAARALRRVAHRWRLWTLALVMASRLGCRPPARGGVRHPRDSGAPLTRRRRHDHDLPARAQPGWPGPDRRGRGPRPSASGRTCGGGDLLRLSGGETPRPERYRRGRGEVSHQAVGGWLRSPDAARGFALADRQWYGAGLRRVRQAVQGLTSSKGGAGATPQRRRCS